MPIGDWREEMYSNVFSFHGNQYRDIIALTLTEGIWLVSTIFEWTDDNIVVAYNTAMDNIDFFISQANTNIAENLWSRGSNMGVAFVQKGSSKKITFKIYAYGDFDFKLSAIIMRALRIYTQPVYQNYHLQF